MKISFFWRKSSPLIGAKSCPNNHDEAKPFMRIGLSRKPSPDHDENTVKRIPWIDVVFLKPSA